MGSLDHSGSSNRWRRCPRSNPHGRRGAGERREYNPMKNRSLITRFLQLSLALLSFALLACNLSNAPSEEVFSFPDLQDSLSRFDSAQIILKNEDGTTLDTLFHGPVGDTTRLSGLSAPDYKGGKV